VDHPVNRYLRPGLGDPGILGRAAVFFIVFSIPVYIGAFSDQFVEWLWKGFREGAKKSGPITRIKTVICLCILGLTLFVGVPLAIASVRNF
jgi:hypothetical protein